MEYITRKQFNELFSNQSIIEPQDLVYVLEEKLGYSVSLKKKRQLTEGQKRHMTEAIFSNEEVLRQLRESALEPEEDYIFDEKESERLIREARNGD